MKIPFKLIEAFSKVIGFGTGRRLTFASILLVIFSPVGYAEEADRPNLEGVYTEKLVSPKDSRWEVHDYICEVCTLEGLAYTKSLLKDPANDDRTIPELQKDVKQFEKKYIYGLLTNEARDFMAGYDMKDDPINRCVPPGLARQNEMPLPVKIEQYSDKVIIQHEWFNTVRTVYMDGRGHPPGLEPSSHGHSIGWYDGDTLVVETTALEPKLTVWFKIPGLINSTQARIIERYTLRENDRLDIEWTLVDPRKLRQPLTFKRTRLLVPGMEILEDHCELVPAG